MTWQGGVTALVPLGDGALLSKPRKAKHKPPEADGASSSMLARRGTVSLDRRLSVAVGGTLQDHGNDSEGESDDESKEAYPKTVRQALTLLCSPHPSLHTSIHTALHTSLTRRFTRSFTLPFTCPRHVHSHLYSQVLVTASDDGTLSGTWRLPTEHLTTVAALLLRCRPAVAADHRPPDHRGCLAAALPPRCSGCPPNNLPPWLPCCCAAAPL
jgi:hypothetical protein